MSHMYSSWFHEWDPFSNFTMMTPFTASWFFVALINLWRVGSRESTLIPRVLRTLVSLTRQGPSVSQALDRAWTNIFPTNFEVKAHIWMWFIEWLDIEVYPPGLLGWAWDEFSLRPFHMGYGRYVLRVRVDNWYHGGCVLTGRSFTHSIWGNVVSAWPDCTSSVSMLNKVDISSDMEATPDSGGTSSIWVTLEELLQTACMWPVFLTSDTLLANEDSFPCVGAGCPIHGIGCHSQGTQILMRGMSWF